MAAQAGAWVHTVTSSRPNTNHKAGHSVGMHAVFNKHLLNITTCRVYEGHREVTTVNQAGDPALRGPSGHSPSLQSQNPFLLEGSESEGRWDREKEQSDPQGQRSREASIGVEASS